MSQGRPAADPPGQRSSSERYGAQGQGNGAEHQSTL